MYSITAFIVQIIDLYWYVLILTAIMSWLLAFDVVNFRNNIVRMVWNFLNAVTEPVLAPIRRLLPNLGGVDISPIILLLLLSLIRNLVIEYGSRGGASYQ